MLGMHIGSDIFCRYQAVPIFSLFRPPELAIQIAGFEGLSLVKVLFPFSNGKLYLDVPALTIQGDGYNRQTFHLELFGEVEEFLFVDEEGAGAVGVKIRGDILFLPGGNVCAEEDE